MFELNYYSLKFFVVDVEILIILIQVVWLIALSAVLIWVVRKILRLTKNVKEGNLLNVLEKVLEIGDKNSLDLGRLEKDLLGLKEDSNLHVQKVGLVKFNPFQETGGDHSFTLAFLDGKDNGFILTGLHTRERTRVYVKDVKRGKSKVSLSKEEKEALMSAQKR